MLHGDVRMIVRDAQIVDLHDVLVFQAGDDLIFLQESIEADEALGDIRHLAEHLEDHESPRPLALGKIDLAHAAAADLTNAAVAPDDHRTESIAAPKIGIGAQQGEGLAMLARGDRDQFDEPISVASCGRTPGVCPARRRLRQRRIFEQHQNDRREFGLRRLAIANFTAAALGGTPR